MVYEIKFSDTAKSGLGKLDKSVARRIIDKLDEIKENPFTYVKRLIGISLYSLRVGDYRVIMSINNNAMLIFGVKIGHRRGVYSDL